jgi:hypothetical protein
VLNHSACADWRAVFSSDKGEKTQEYFVYFQFLRQDQAEKEPARCAWRVVQRLLNKKASGAPGF